MYKPFNEMDQLSHEVGTVVPGHGSELLAQVLVQLVLLVWYCLGHSMEP